MQVEELLKQFSALGALSVDRELCLVGILVLDPFRQEDAEECEPKLEGRAGRSESSVQLRWVSYLGVGERYVNVAIDWIVMPSRIDESLNHCRGCTALKAKIFELVVELLAICAGLGQIN